MSESSSRKIVSAGGYDAAVEWLRKWGWLVALIAAAATIGDLGQLWTVNAARPALGLAAPPKGIVPAATLAGTLGIPLYAVGYYVRAHRARRKAPKCAAVVAIAGAALAVVGGSLHAVSGVLIVNNVGGITGGLDPIAGMLAGGPIVLALWAITAAFFVCAAISEACLPQARVARLFNPAVLVLLLSAAASLLPLPLPDFVGPAALNIAHLLFFARLGLLD